MSAQTFTRRQIKALDVKPFKSAEVVAWEARREARESDRYMIVEIGTNVFTSVPREAGPRRVARALRETFTGWFEPVLQTAEFGALIAATARTAQPGQPVYLPQVQLNVYL